jgi:FKBP-type peptidyl-prolyl cis-trans isomerase
MAEVGYTKTILVEGTGPEAGIGATVSMHYTGWLKDTSRPEGKGKK